MPGARRLLRRVLGLAALPFVALAAPAIAVAARTGVGVELCRRFGFHPLRVHFYAPVPEYESVPPQYFAQPQPFPGFEIDRERVRPTLERLGAFASECDWPAAPGAPGEYHSDNEMFGYASAALLHSMLRAHRTRRAVEVGSGYSTLITLDALERNGGGELTCIEPYPAAWLEARLARSGATLVRSKAQDVPLATFECLAAGDLLFIDSSHVAKLAADVNFLLLQVLPRLRPGVLVHVHDIYIPYEYPAVHFFGPDKQFWNEQYLLQAFLTLNPAFEILLPGYFVQTDMEREFAAAFPAYDPARHRRNSSFWLRRRA